MSIPQNLTSCFPKRRVVLKRAKFQNHYMQPVLKNLRNLRKLKGSLLNCEFKMFCRNCWYPQSLLYWKYSKPAILRKPKSPLHFFRRVTRSFWSKTLKPLFISELSGEKSQCFQTTKALAFKFIELYCGGTDWGGGGGSRIRIVNVFFRSFPESSLLRS